MIDTLERLLQEVATLNCQLVILAGASESKTKGFLREFGIKVGLTPLNVSLELAHRLASLPKTERGTSAAQLLRSMTAIARTDAPLLLENLELLFSPDLHVNPLDLIKRLAHSRPVVAIWPGEVHVDRLIYADTNHLEHRDYGRDGLVVMEIGR